MSRPPRRHEDPQAKIGLRSASGQPKGRREPAFRGDFPIRIARDGTWYHEGAPIPRKALVKLFSTVLKRDESGAYWLETPAERGRIRVDDAPFTAVELSREGEGRGQVLRFRSNLDDWVTAGPEHPIRVALAPDTGEPAPYVVVRDRLEALIVRSVYYEMVELAVEHCHLGRIELGLWSSGVFFPLGGPAGGST